jgi:hypothetical protein
MNALRVESEICLLVTDNVFSFEPAFLRALAGIGRISPRERLRMEAGRLTVQFRSGNGMKNIAKVHLTSSSRGTQATIVFSGR